MIRTSLSGRPTRSKSRRPVVRPGIESLEDRRLLTLALDTSFGAGGTTVFPLSAGDQGSVASIAVQQDGKIVEVGTIQPGSSLFRESASVIAVSRLTSAGALDPTFGSNGVATIQLGSNILSASSVAIAPGGDVVVVGTESQGTVSKPTNPEVFVARLLPSGMPDTSFGAGTGEVAVVFPDDTATGTSALVQPDGKIIAVGTVQTTGAAATSEFGAARLNLDGSLDSTFGSSGRVTVLVTANIYPAGKESDSNTAKSAIVQSDGKILIGGFVVAGDLSGAPIPSGASSEGFAVVSLDTDGSLDDSFGTKGTATTDFKADGLTDNYLFQQFGMALQAGGQIVLGVTYQENLTHYSIAGSSLARLNADGSSDSTFASSPGGLIAIAPDGRIAVATYEGVSLLSANGATLAGLGLSTTFSVSAVAFQTDGKVILAGTEVTAGSTTPTEAAVARLNGQSPAADYFGTGQTDFAVDTPSAGVFSIETASGSRSETAPFGPPTDLFAPITGDFDGDGKADLALYDSQDGLVAYRPSKGGADVVRVIGMAGGIPAVGDYLGGVSAVAVYYPKFGVFANVPITPSGVPGDPNTKSIQLGVPGLSVPAVGAYDGSGYTNLGVYIPRYSVFSYLPQGVSTPTSIQFGPTGTDLSPAIGDYDGDGLSDLALYSSQFSLFLYKPSSGGPPVAVQFGPPNLGFVAVPGDYDGDGKTDLAIYNAQYGLFLYRPSSGGKDRMIQFGPTGDQGIAVLTAGAGTGFISESSVHVESAGAGSLAAPVVIGSLGLMDDPSTAGTASKKAPGTH